MYYFFIFLCLFRSGFKFYSNCTTNMYIYFLVRNFILIIEFIFALIFYNTKLSITDAKKLYKLYV